MSELQDAMAVSAAALNARIDQALDKGEYGPGGHLYSAATTLLAALGGDRDYDDDMARATKKGRWAVLPDSEDQLVAALRSETVSAWLRVIVHGMGGDMGSGAPLAPSLAHDLAHAIFVALAERR